MVEVPSKLKPFTGHGVLFTGEEGNQLKGDCPFCDAEHHFFANKETGQWDCKKCGRTGNTYTFLEMVWKEYHSKTTTAKLRELSLDRGLPVRALKRFRMAWTGTHWLIPCFSQRGTVHDLRNWSFKSRRIMATSGCKLNLFGTPRLKEVTKDSIIWLCEGEWDVMAMSELLVIAKRKGDAVLGVPGANSFKAEWLEFFKDRHVRICYDNDDAGDNGSLKAYKMLKGVAKKIEFLCWPDSLPTGYDIRDFVKAALEADDNGVEALQRFDTLFSEKHRRDAGEESNEPPGRESYEVLPPEERPTFSMIRDTLAENMYFDDEIDMALRVVLAVMLTESLPYSPLWLQLVAPPGGGKTMLLSLGSTSDRVIFRSSVSPKSLVSGYKEGMRPDPSLLRYLNDHVLIIKDGTEILSLPAVQQDEVWSIFRGAYDGSLSRSYGNGVLRDYNLHFSVLMGVTPIIEAHNKAALGDRFLRLYMRAKDETELDHRIDAAIESLYSDAQTENNGKDLVRRFLAREPITAIRIPAWGLKRIRGLSKLVSALRISINRDPYDRDNILTRPQEEVGTRLAQQLAKLAIGLAHVDGVKEITERHFAIVQRVALDTAIGLYLEIINLMASDMDKGWTRSELEGRLNMPMTTVERRIDDLHQSRIIECSKSPTAGKVGKPSRLYRLAPRIASRWAEAAIGELPLGGASIRLRLARKQPLPGLSPRGAVQPQRERLKAPQRGSNSVFRASAEAS